METLPLVAIIGRPNVGKSTLFNRLTKSRQALVDDTPGVTRDRLYGRVIYNDYQFTLIDTGGFDPPADQQFASEVLNQIEIALEQADVLIFVLDSKAGFNPLDQEVANYLRKTNKPMILAVNKVDGPTQEQAADEFMRLGLSPIHYISAAHGYGIPDFLDKLVSLLPEPQTAEQDGANSEKIDLRISLLGRPNVGKSSLLNVLLGENRAVVSPIPGTTRDALDTDLWINDQHYVLIDTAGIRRKAKIDNKLEKASIFRSLRAIERSHLVCLLLDASQPLADQDIRLAGEAMEAYRALMFIYNKMDLIKGKEDEQKRLKMEEDRLRKIAPWAPIACISSLTGQNVKKLVSWWDKIYAQYNQRITTGMLNQGLEKILNIHQPPVVKGSRLKFFYATQIGVRPPTVVLFVNQPQNVHFSYQRYLANQLRKVMSLGNSPLRIIYRKRGTETQR